MIVRNKTALLIVVAMVFFVGALLLGRVIGPQILSLNLKYPGVDKLVHIMASLLLVMVAFYVIRYLKVSMSAKMAVLVSAIAALLVGVSEELLQVLSSYRSVELGDLLSNFIGVIAGVLVLTVGRRKALTNAVAIVVMTGATILVVYDSYRSNIDYHNGLISMRSGDYDGAYSYFEKAMSDGNTQPGLYNEAAWVMLEFLEVDFERALEYTSMALGMRPASADIMDTHGWALHKTGRSEEAIGFLMRSYEAKPDGYCIQYHLGAVYFSLGSVADAEVFLKRQLDLSATDRYGVASRKLLDQIALR